MSSRKNDPVAGIGAEADENAIYDFIVERGRIDDFGSIDKFEPKVHKAFEKTVGLDTEHVFVFPTVPSTQALDSYGTRMSASSIREYRRNGNEGVPLMDSHKTSGWFGDIEQPLGYSFYAEVEGDAVDETSLFARLEKGEKEKDFDLLSEGLKLRVFDYMLRGHYPNGRMKLGTDDVIMSIEGKTTRSISIGFSRQLSGRPMELICGLCGEPLFSEGCDHVPLTVDKDTGLLAFVWINGARMREHSLVWQGATPGAIVDKARSVAKKGGLNAVEIDLLESTWGVRIAPVSVRLVPDAPDREVFMSKRKEKEPEEGEIEEVEPESDVSEPEPEPESESSPEEEVAGSDGEEGIEPEHSSEEEEEEAEEVEEAEVEADGEEGQGEEETPDAEPEPEPESEPEPEPVGEAEEEEEGEKGNGSEDDRVVVDTSSLAELGDRLGRLEKVIGSAHAETRAMLEAVSGDVAGLTMRVEVLEEEGLTRTKRQEEELDEYREGLVRMAVEAKVRTGVVNVSRYEARVRKMTNVEIKEEIVENTALARSQWISGRPTVNVSPSREAKTTEAIQGGSSGLASKQPGHPKEDARLYRD